MKKKEKQIINKYLKKVYKIICTEKLKILYVTILIVLSLLLMINTQTIINGIINTVIFSVSTISITISIIRNYKKSKEISNIYLIGINIVSIICFFNFSHMSFHISILLIRAVSFTILVILGLWVVLKAKVIGIKKFNKYFLISLFTVILNFGGIYESLYSMYFPTDQACFKIDQELSYKRVVTNFDFVYYSADAFFGTEISDVKIKYIDYTDYFEKEKVISHYPQNHDKAMVVISIAKMFSLSESILFIIYISMIVMNINSKRIHNNRKIRRHNNKIHNNRKIRRYNKKIHDNRKIRRHKK